ncbi:MAG: Cys-tRNA(Pro) deacylase [Acidimicrobiales bacterium]
MAARGTPATVALQRAKVAHTLHQYEHDPAVRQYGTEAVEALGLDAARTFKTLIAAPANGGKLVCAVVPVAAQLDLKALAAAAGVKQMTMAEPAAAERATGYVLGGISPLGQKQRLATFIDESAQHHPTVFLSAGRRGLEVELSPADLAQLTDANFAAIARTTA